MDKCIFCHENYDEKHVCPARVEHGTPCAYRLARYPDGSVVLQGAFKWERGALGGVEWRDLPTVNLSITGMEVPR